MKITNIQPEKFEIRHLGPDEEQMKEMLQFIKADSLEQLISETIPQSIRLQNELNLPQPKTEFDFINSFKKLANKNKIFRSFIGLGYYNCVVPGVIQRNILENPGWYTAYTPYQAEVAQGRLEALINFQTLVSDLTRMDLSNASLLDEGTAAAEAMGMMYSLRKGSKKKAIKFFVDRNIFPQTIGVLKTRAVPYGIELVIDDYTTINLGDSEVFGALVQYPAADGAVRNYKNFVSEAHQNDILVAFATDLLSLTLLTPPGEMGADIVVGNTQRFGVPMGYGGPHAAFLATKDEYKRQIPGRIIGVSVDKHQNKAYRMALQTREQHIKREKANSNICTAQVLLAVMAGMYGVYHGPRGLRQIAEKIHFLSVRLSESLKALGYKQKNVVFFDTIKIEISTDNKEEVKRLAEAEGINLRYDQDGHIGISVDETTSDKDVVDILTIFGKAAGISFTNNLPSVLESPINEELERTSEYLTHPVFNSYHKEHEMLRYIKKLENKDVSLVHSMIPLGSCTMKLNATAEMTPLSWPEFSSIHPFVPQNQAEGYNQLFTELEQWLSEITGFDATSLQPNSGAQGEYAGLMVVRAFHENNGDKNRNVALIPSSAHGTNPASAVMAGMEVIIVKCDEKGNIDIEDLRQKAVLYKERLSVLMVTYPSTHGVYEENIREICQIIHENGGQVYMDGANMNAQVGLTSPANIGADVCHLNLHKTFCIPHGGGGPGMGPICVAKHLKPFLPGNPLIKSGGDMAIDPVSSAPWGSASILTISYAYIALMGAQGLKKATQIAILNANYIKEKLISSYPVLYAGKNGRCAHEMIIDCREFKKVGIEVEDIAKRLMDYGFHAPTVSFPVPGTLMIEPTESEAKHELDRFCDALISIRKEIREVEEGKFEKDNNVLKNAPHTSFIATADTWLYPYSREKAVYPLEFVREKKFWPSVGRVDNAYGDRNLFCSCIPVESYEEQETELSVS